MTPQGGLTATLMVCIHIMCTHSVIIMVMMILINLINNKFE